MCALGIGRVRTLTGARDLRARVAIATSLSGRAPPVLRAVLGRVKGRADCFPLLRRAGSGGDEPGPCARCATAPRPATNRLETGGDGTDSRGRLRAHRHLLGGNACHPREERVWAVGLRGAGHDRPEASRWKTRSCDPVGEWHAPSSMCLCPSIDGSSWAHPTVSICLPRRRDANRLRLACLRLSLRVPPEHGPTG